MATSPWQPSRPVVMLLGILSVWPIVYFALFMSFIFFTFATRNAGSFEPFRYVFALHLLTMLLMVVLTTVYVIHAFRTDRIAEDRRVLWVVILFFGNVIAFPIYWYLYLWRPRGAAS